MSVQRIRPSKSATPEARGAAANQNVEKAPQSLRKYTEKQLLKLCAQMPKYSQSAQKV